MIKKNDIVMIMTGKDSGKTGKVLSIDSARDRITIDGLNVFKKHRRPKKQGEKGEIIIVPRSVHRSNVMLYCSSCKKGVRVGIRDEKGARLRSCKQCGGTI